MSESRRTLKVTGKLCPELCHELLRKGRGNGILVQDKVQEVVWSWFSRTGSPNTYVEKRLQRVKRMEPLDRLTGALSKLPGIGQRSAGRIALKLACDTGNLLTELVTALNEVSEKLRICSRCGAITVVSRDPCRFCTDRARDKSVLYVVEDPSDVFPIERAGGIRGRYHVLMGKISPMNGKGPWDLRLERLLHRIDEECFKEVILALNTDMESDATAAFIQELLRDRNVKVTRLAFGLPIGSGIAYSDPVTLERAIKGRQRC